GSESRIPQIEKCNSSDKRDVGGAELPNEFIPHIGNALHANQPRRIGHGLIFGVGEPFANASSHPRRGESVSEHLSDLVHEGASIGFGTNAGSKVVNLDGGLAVALDSGTQFGR